MIDNNNKINPFKLNLSNTTCTRRQFISKIDSRFTRGLLNTTNLPPFSHVLSHRLFKRMRLYEFFLSKYWHPHRGRTNRIIIIIIIVVVYLLYGIMYLFTHNVCALCSHHIAGSRILCWKEIVQCDMIFAAWTELITHNFIIWIV